MIKNYLVTITFMDPYPRESSYRSAASNIRAAVGKGLKGWRKENKGRKIKQLTIKAIQL